MTLDDGQFHHKRFKKCDKWGSFMKNMTYKVTSANNQKEITGILWIHDE